MDKRPGPGHSALMITRRDTTKLLLGSAIATALPGGAGAASRDEWIRALNIALGQATRGKTRLRLTGFGVQTTRRQTVMAAVVRMDWPPGFRTRPFNITADTEKEAFNTLVRAVIDEFKSVNPEVG